MKRSVFWDSQACSDFDDTIREMHKYPFLCAGNLRPGKIKRAVLAKTRQLSFRPGMHPPDGYKFNNSGNFRAFEVHGFRVAYQIKKTEVIILKVQHEQECAIQF